MKKKYINIAILVLCAVVVVALYLYDVLCNGAPYTEDLFKVVALLISFILIFKRSKKRLEEQNYNPKEEFDK